MGHIPAGPRPDIYYFESETFENMKKGSPLKTFLYFLKRQRVTGPVRFSFIDSEGSLLPGLSLKENISLDCVSANVSSAKNFTLEDYLDRNTNKDLVELYNSISLPDDKPNDVDSRTRKTAALVKGLLQKSDYIFLEGPEKYLDEDTLKIFTRALIKGLSKNNQTLLLLSDQPKLWLPYVTKTVQEDPCPQSGKMLLKVTNSIGLTYFSQSQQESGKMVFNLPQDPTPNHLEEEKEDKKAA